MRSRSYNQSDLDGAASYKKKYKGTFNNDNRYIIAESGKVYEATTDRIDEEEDEMKETSNLMGNSTSNVVSERHGMNGRSYSNLQNQQQLPKAGPK